MDLNRFIEAHEKEYEQARSEIRSGRKKNSWIWYIFPQYKGLGSSEISKKYSIQSLDEERAYLGHPVLGVRLRQISNDLLKLNESNPHRIFGSPDDLKLKSSMTLFSVVDESDDKVFFKVLDKYYNPEIVI